MCLVLADEFLLDYIVYDIWLAIECLVVYFVFVETRGFSLEETAAILDGEDVQAQIIQGVSRATEELKFSQTDKTGTPHMDPVEA